MFQWYVSWITAKLTSHVSVLVSQSEAGVRRTLPQCQIDILLLLDIKPTYLVYFQWMLVEFFIDFVWNIILPFHHYNNWSVKFLITRSNLPLKCLKLMVSWFGRKLQSWPLIDVHETLIFTCGMVKFNSPLWDNFVDIALVHNKRVFLPWSFTW